MGQNLQNILQPWRFLLQILHRKKSCEGICALLEKFSRNNITIFRSGFIFTFTSVSYFLVFFFFSFLLFSDLYFFYSLLFIFLCLLALFSLVHMRKLSCYLPFFSLLIFHIPSVSLEKMSLSYFMFICAFLIRQTNESFTIFSVVPRQLWPLHCGNTHLKPTDHCSVYPSSPQSVSWMDVHESGVLWLHHRSVIL